MGKQLTLESREGGREENPDAASPSEARPRNSSGSASAAANLLDLRIGVMALTEALLEVCTHLGLEEVGTRLRRARQQGFRRGR